MEEARKFESLLTKHHISGISDLEDENLKHEKR